MLQLSLFNFLISSVIFIHQSPVSYGRIINDANRHNYEGAAEGMCPHPDTNANSLNNLSEQWSPVGTVVNYTCDPGFYIFGNDYRICQLDGKWSGEAPLCMKKVSFGKNVSCTGVTCEQMQPNDFLLLVDDNQETCAKLPPSPRETSLWKVDLLENFSAIRAFRFIFHGNSADVPIIRMFLESKFQRSAELLPTDCQILQKELEMGYKELVIYPNVLQSARYITLEMKTRDQSQNIGFCEAEVYSERAPSVHQCYDINNLDDTQQTRNHIKGTMTYMGNCYTFDGQTNPWPTANQRCKATNGGTLAHDISLDVNSALINFVKARNYYTNFWLGGHTKKQIGTNGEFFEWQWITGRNVDQQIWFPQSSPSNECIGFHAPSGIWMNYPCHSFTGSICQTEVKRCGSPDINTGVRTTNRYSLVVGARIDHGCPNDYTLVGDVQRECLPNGIWSGRSPQCIHKDAVRHSGELEMTQGAVIGIVIGGIVIGLLIIIIVITIVVIKRRGSFKQTIHFKKDKHGESVEALEENEKKSKEPLGSVETQNYQSVSQEPQQATAAY